MGNKPGAALRKPFTDFDPSGIAGTFDAAKREQLIRILEDIDRRAAAWVNLEVL
ncbi:MAG: hypothetical protein ACREHV_08790 [Rhizomicrobium sp.]